MLASWATVAAADLNPVQLFKSVAPAIVRVRIVEEPNADGKVTTWAFSGCLVSEQGLVVTNMGSGAPISRVWVEKDGLSYLAEMIGSDPPTNLALLQLVKLPEKFGALSLQGDVDRPPIGTPIMRVASPLELDPSPTLGLVTGYESSLPSGVFPFTYARINLPAGPGDGGAPVVDASGQLVGIIVASVPEIASSYLVPSRALRRIVDDLQRQGHVSYGALPIDFAERPDANNLARQVIVLSVTPNSSASRADIRPGDIVRRIGSTPVRRIHDVRDELFASRPGQFITVELERDGTPVHLALRVEERQVSPRIASPTPPIEEARTSREAEPPKLQAPTRPSDSLSFPEPH